MKKRFISFFVLCLFFLGSIGGIGYAIYSGAYLIAVGVAGLTYLAIPEAYKHYQKIVG